MAFHLETVLNDAVGENRSYIDGSSLDEAITVSTPKLLNSGAKYAALYEAPEEDLALGSGELRARYHHESGWNTL